MLMHSVQDSPPHNASCNHVAMHAHDTLWKAVNELAGYCKTPPAQVTEDYFVHKQKHGIATKCSLHKGPVLPNFLPICVRYFQSVPYICNIKVQCYVHRSM